MDALISDDVIKRRLLVDGDGVGDDRRILALMKTYVQFCISKDDDPVHRMMAHRRLISNIHNVGMSLQRTQEMVRVNENTHKMFDDLGKSLRVEVEETKGHVSDYKRLLEEATKHRKHAMEYDALAKLILSQPDRKLTETKKKQLTKELQELKKRESKLNNELSGRCHNMTILTHTIEKLKRLIEGDSGEPPGGDQRSLSEDVDDDMEVDDCSTSAIGSIANGHSSAPMEVETEAATIVTTTPSSSSSIVGGKERSSRDKTKSDKDKLHEDLSESEGEQPT